MVGAVRVSRPAWRGLSWNREFGAGGQHEAKCQQHAAAGHAQATHPELLTHRPGNERRLVEQRTLLEFDPYPVCAVVVEVTGLAGGPKAYRGTYGASAHAATSGDEIGGCAIMVELTLLLVIWAVGVAAVRLVRPRPAVPNPRDATMLVQDQCRRADRWNSCEKHEEGQTAAVLARGAFSEPVV